MERNMTCLIVIFIILITNTLADVIISEMCDPQNEYRKNRFIEIYNTGESSVNLTNWKVVAIANDSEIFIWNLSGMIEPADALVCGDDENTLITPDFTESSWSDDNFSWNGGEGDGTKLLNGEILIDDASSHGDFADKSTIRISTVVTATTTFSSEEWTTTATTNYENASPGSHTYVPIVNAWINEIHYDNEGADVNEGIEIIIENPSNYSLANFTVTLYNGSNGESYDSETLDNFSVGSTISDFTIYYDTTTTTWNSGIQNGAPDGIALSYDDSLIQFLSYEGSFTATDGNANGKTSTDIGVLENATAEGLTIQLTGSGTQYSDFSWESGLPQTWGTQNSDGETDQSLPVSLQKFNALPGDRKVTLTWITESETENLGFNLYRKTSNYQYRKINDILIDGHGSTSEMHEYSYTDHDVVNGVTYRYKIENVDYSGKTELHNIVVTATPTVQKIKSCVNAFRLQPCYPNPFNPETTLCFELTETANVYIRVYNLQGKIVTTLTTSSYQPGEYNLSWNGTDAKNRQVSSGIYLIQTVSSTGFSHTDKVILLR